MKIIAALLAAATIALAATLPAQEPGFFTSAAAGTEWNASDAELDQMLAPVALYPDSLLTQVFVASTYPLEVVYLKRWLDAHPGLEGEALDNALARQPWDASVKALARFPALVAKMNDELEWTQRLGNAFLASEERVMQSIQRLRSHAMSSGNLQDSSQVRVIVEEGSIGIESAAPDIVYVPYYDPRFVYGPWWWPAYPPYYWGDYWWGGSWYGFGFGFVVGGGWGHYPHVDWHHHRVNVHGSHGDFAWSHDRGHRGGVPYPTPSTHQRYAGPVSPSPSVRQPYRGFEPPRVQGAPAPSRSPLAPQARDVARAQSQRGHASLGPALTQRAPSQPAHAPSQPSHEQAAAPAPSHAQAPRGSVPRKP